MNFDNSYRFHDISGEKLWKSDINNFDERIDNNDKSGNIPDAHSFNPDQRIQLPDNVETRDKDSEIVSEKQPIEYRRTTNESLEGDRHPITGVEFKRKIVEYSDGRRIEGVFAAFESKVDMQLPPELYKSSFLDQKNYLGERMQEMVKDPNYIEELKSKFTDEEIEEFKQGIIPEGYVWHHNEEEGKMQLVDAEIHEKTGHTGGMSLWGRGY